MDLKIFNLSALTMVLANAIFNTRAADNPPLEEKVDIYFKNDQQLAEENFLANYNFLRWSENYIDLDFNNICMVNYLAKLNRLFDNLDVICDERNPVNPILGLNVHLTKTKSKFGHNWVKLPLQSLMCSCKTAESDEETKFAVIEYASDELSKNKFYVLKDVNPAATELQVDFYWEIEYPLEPNQTNETDRLSKRPKLTEIL